jgi:hypothetical protein
MDNSEIIVSLNEVAENLPTYYKSQLLDFIKDFAEDKDLCPNCGEEFERYTYDDILSEYGDGFYSEQVEEKQCECGYNTVFKEV